MCVSVTLPTLQTYNGGETRRDKNKNKSKIKIRRERVQEKKKSSSTLVQRLHCVGKFVLPFFFFLSSSSLSSVCQQNAKHWTDAFIKASGSHFELCRFVKSTVPPPQKKKDLQKQEHQCFHEMRLEEEQGEKRPALVHAPATTHESNAYQTHTYTKKNAKATRRVTHDHSPIMNEIAAEVVDEHLFFFFFVCVFACLSSWCIPSICIHIYIYMRLLQSFPSHGTIKTTETK